MKINDIELTTTSKELNELLHQKSNTEEREAIATLEELLTKTTATSLRPPTRSGIAIGFICGATAYARRLAEQGAAMMHQTTGDELAVVEAFGVKEREIATLRAALTRIEKLEAEADGCVGVVDNPHTKALRAAAKCARTAAHVVRGDGGEGQ